jgi:hypothetical protein
LSVVFFISFFYFNLFLNIMANNYSNPNQPIIKRSSLARGPERSTFSFPGKSSQAYYVGQIVSIVNGTDAAPTGQEGFVGPWADDALGYGIVEGFKKRKGILPIQDDANRSGTVTDATSFLPMKYTFAATNDELSGSSALLEQVVVTPIYPGDTLEMCLVNDGGTALVSRATTTAAGTTNSSDNTNVGLAVNATAPFALTESTANKTLANLDFLTTLVDGNKPANTKHVYVKLIRSSEVFKNVE